MKKRSIIFIVCIILMNSLSGCKIRDKEYLMVCEKNEETTYGEAHKIVELHFVNDELLLKNTIEEGTYDVNNHKNILEDINDDYIKYSTYKGVNYSGNTTNNSNFKKELSINISKMKEGLFDFFDVEAISKKNKVSYTYEYNQLKEKGYACKLEDLEVNDTVIVKSIIIAPLDRIESFNYNEYGEKYISNGYQIEVTFEPYNVEHWGESNPTLFVWHDQKLYREIYDSGPIINELLGTVSELPKKANSSTVAIGTGDEQWLNPSVPIKEEYVITMDEIEEYIKALDEVLITVVYNSKTMRSQKVKVTK